MRLNRKLQYDVLFALQEVYPDSLLVSALPYFSHKSEFMGNLFYLQEHGLITGGDIREPGQCRSMVDAQITQLGLDFLADDGGLAAILGGVTAKIQYHEIIDVLDDCLAENNLEKEKLRSLEKALKKMSSNGMKNVILNLLKANRQELPEMILSIDN